MPHDHEAVHRDHVLVDRFDEFADRREEIPCDSGERRGKLVAAGGSAAGDSAADNGQAIP